MRPNHDSIVQAILLVVTKFCQPGHREEWNQNDNSTQSFDTRAPSDAEQWFCFYARLSGGNNNDVDLSADHRDRRRPRDQLLLLRRAELTPAFKELNPRALATVPTSDHVTAPGRLHPAPIP